MISFPSPGRAAAWPILLFVLLTTATLPAPAFAQAPRVSAIEIRGNERINETAIRSAISTQVGDEFSAERLERDRLAVENLGWFRLVAVTPQREAGNQVRVVFTLQEYPVLKELQITGASRFTEEEIRAGLKTKVGQVFNRVDWDADMLALTRRYTDEGLQMNPLFDVSGPGATFFQDGVLRLELRELRVGRVDIKWPLRDIKNEDGEVVRREASHKTRNYVVLRELSLKPGELYNSKLVTKDYRALTNLGFFETVRPQVDIQEDLTVSIVWELTERRTGQVTVGAGYSPRQSLIGRAELADQNFRGKGQSVGVSAEIGTFGGDGLPSLELQFFEPWLTKDRTSLNISLYNKLVWRFSRSLLDQDRFESRYFERRVGGIVSFGRPFKWPVTVGFRYDDVTTRDLPRRVRFPRQDGTVASVNVLRAWNSRDYANSPTSGGLTRLSTEVGHASLDKSANEPFRTSVFNKSILDIRRYWALKRLKATEEPQREQEAQKTPVVAARLLGGATIGQLPFFEQFFVGGAESLRGYLEDRYWGKYMFLASIEYRRPVMNRIVGVLFADAGSAWGTESSFQFGSRRLQTQFRQDSGFTIHPSVGVGIRVTTPIGPIRLDLGFGEEGSRTHFSIGHTF